MEGWFKNRLTDPTVGDEGFPVAVFILNLPGLSCPFVITDNVRLGPAL